MQAYGFFDPVGRTGVHAEPHRHIDFSHGTRRVGPFGRCPVPMESMRELDRLGTVTRAFPTELRGRKIQIQHTEIFNRINIFFSTAT
jgi:hypothetical protein